MRETETKPASDVDIFAVCAADRYAYSELLEYDDVEECDSLVELVSDLRGLSYELGKERPNLTYLNSGCDALLAVYDGVKKGNNFGGEWRDEIYSRLYAHGDVVAESALNEILKDAVAGERLEKSDIIDSLAEQYVGLLQELEERTKTRMHDASPYRLKSIARNEAGKEQRLEELVATLKETLAAIVMEGAIVVSFDEDLCQEMISFVFGVSKAKAICYLAGNEQAGFGPEVVERAQNMINDTNIDRAKSILDSLVRVLDDSDGQQD